MRNVFINVGAGKGSDIDGFLNMSPDHKDWEIFVFECNPNLIPTIRSKHPTANIMEYAASTKDGNSKLYLGKQYVNSSLNPNKINVSKDDYLEVQTIDFSKWLLDTFTKDDNIILTLDIEGAEYDLLEKMIGDDSLDLIDELYIEFHGKKISTVSMHYERHLVNYLINMFRDKVYIYEYYNHEQFIKLNNEAVK